MVISPLIWVITIVTLLTTPLITADEPPSRVLRGKSTSGSLIHSDPSHTVSPVCTLTPACNFAPSLCMPDGQN